MVPRQQWMEEPLRLELTSKDATGPAIQAYGAGAGSVVMQILNSDFTGEEESDCGSQGGGRSAIYLEDSFVRMDNIDISQNSYGAFLRSSSGLLTQFNSYNKV